MADTKHSEQTAKGACGPGHCYLLELPIELQLQIYEYAVIEEEIIMISKPCLSCLEDSANNVAFDTKEHDWEARDHVKRLQPPLAQTSNFIRQTVLPIYYKQNRFMIYYCALEENCGKTRSWIQALSTECRELMSDFYVYNSGDARDAEHSTTCELEMLECEVVVDDEEEAELRYCAKFRKG